MRRADSGTSPRCSKPDQKRTSAAAIVISRDARQLGPVARAASGPAVRAQPLSVRAAAGGAAGTAARARPRPQAPAPQPACTARVFVAIDTAILDVRFRMVVHQVTWHSGESCRAAGRGS